MGYETKLDFRKINVVVKRVVIGVAVEFNEKIIVDKRLRPCSDILSAELLGFKTIIAVAKYRRPTLCRRSSEIGELHEKPRKYKVKITYLTLYYDFCQKSRKKRPFSCRF